jgi:excinuclease UvrABC nuclease subunit
MSGEAGTLLYVGQSRNLRTRLNSYKNLNPERASRKIVRLVHQVRSIAWERCLSPAEALLRENYLLRLHKPRFNVANTRPEHYAFLGVRESGSTLTLRITKTSSPEPSESLYGAFKGIHRLRSFQGAVLRLFWASQKQPASPHEIPALLLRAERPEEASLPLEPAIAADGLPRLSPFLKGQSDDLSEWFSERVLPSARGCPFLAHFWEQDLTLIKDFYKFGPSRNRALLEGHPDEPPLIAQEELDDLLALAAKPRSRIQHGTLPQPQMD